MSQKKKWKVNANSALGYQVNNIAACNKAI